MVRNWIFDRFLTEVIRRNQHQPNLVEALQKAIYHNGLHLDLMRGGRGDLTDEVLQALKVTAESIAGGDASLLSEMKDDVQGREMFCSAVGDLLKHFVK